MARQFTRHAARSGLLGAVALIASLVLSGCVDADPGTDPGSGTDGGATGANPFEGSFALEFSDPELIGTTGAELIYLEWQREADFLLLAHATVWTTQGKL